MIRTQPRAARRILIAMFLGLCASGLAPAASSEVRVEENVSYKPAAATELERTQCKLDLYLPTTPGPHPVIVWFHGGGLTSGDKAEMKEVGPLLARSGFVVASANYRLSPAVAYPAYVEDAAAAVAWVHANAAKHGGNPDQLFVGGYSAGGYLATAVGFIPAFLKSVNLTSDHVRGLIAVSPQVFTHYTVRAERGVPDAQNKPLIDDAAPAYYARPDAPPTLLLFGDHDVPTRAEEVRYFAALLKAAKHPDVTCEQIDDRDHGTIFQRLTQPDDPGQVAILKFIRGHLEPAKGATTRAAQTP